MRLSPQRRASQCTAPRASDRIGLARKMNERCRMQSVGVPISAGCKSATRTRGLAARSRGRVRTAPASGRAVDEQRRSHDSECQLGAGAEAARRKRGSNSSPGSQLEARCRLSVHSGVPASCASENHCEPPIGVGSGHLACAQRSSFATRATNEQQTSSIESRSARRRVALASERQSRVAIASDD